MKTFYPMLFVAVILSIIPARILSQTAPIHPSIVKTGIFLGVTPPLRDLPALTPAEVEQLQKKAARFEMNKGLGTRSYPFAATAQPKGPDPVWQSKMGSNDNGPKAPIVNFSGQSSSYYPPDCNGVIGPNHYMQTVNITYSIYNRTGTLLAGPTALNTLFSGVPGSTYNDGDPIVLYDKMANRWLVSEFSISGSNDYMMVAVSTTNDPTGTWYKYSFDVTDMPDYPKFGIWPDGYYMADNNSSGNDIYVFQRSVMLTGGTSPTMIGFDNPYRPTSIDGFMCVPPVNDDGTAAPTGAPGTFIAFNDDAIGGGSDQLWIYELTANWTTPSSSTFSRVQQLAVAAFDANFGNNWNNITQPITQKLDAIPQVIMNVPQYRNFGTYQTLVCCHTVDVDATNHAGIRWYELRRGTQTSGNWAVRQQGTYAPDAASRWMGSIMLSSNGQIGLGYSISSSSIYPGIRYTGQSSTAYNTGAGVMDIAEGTIQTGSSAQTSYNRWGDYSGMSVDPSDDQTFWFTTEYMTSSTNHGTKIASFKFGSPPIVTTLDATSVTGISATLNGTVNPNGIATTYSFSWGTTTSYGNTTTVTSAGSGTSAVNVSAPITGLANGTTYHFRISATNTDGTSSGGDKSFTTPSLNVTPSNQDVTGTAGSTAFTVTSNSTWTYTSDQTWCTLTGTGTGNGTITANYTLNPLSIVRVASITVTVTGLTPVVVTVTQAGNPTLAVTPPNQNVTVPEGSTSFTVTSNTNWTASSDQAWCTVSPSGTGNGTLTANYIQNAYCNIRVANITVTVSGLTPVVVSVTQAAAIPPVLSSSLTPPEICNNSLFSYIPASSTPGTAFAWSRASVPGISNAPASGTGNPNEILHNTTNSTVNVTYVYTLTVNNCINTQNVVVTIDASVTATVSGGGTICAGTPASGPPPLPGDHGSGGDNGSPTIYFALTGTPPWNLTYYDGTASHTVNGILMSPYSFSAVPSGTTTYTATALSDAVCSASAGGLTGSGVITVNPNPVVNPVSDQVTYDGATTNAISFTGTATLYEWTNNNTSIGLAASGTGNIAPFTAVNPGSVPVVATVTVTPKYMNNGVTCTGTPVNFTITVNPAPIKILNITLFLEGYFSTSTGTMQQVQDCTDGMTTFNKFTGQTVDTLSVILANPTDPWSFVYQAHGVPVEPDGSLSLNIPSSFSGSYYIVIRQRSSVETWSALPVSFTGSVITYNFTFSAGQAFGNNMKRMLPESSIYALYTGDVSSPSGSQDGYVDIFDDVDIFNQSTTGAYGYIPDDLNGDGFVDIFDLAMVFNNMQVGAGMITPPNPGKKK
jgi:hypothetical protein